MTTRKSVKAETIRGEAYCIAYMSDRVPYFLPSTTARHRGQCVEAFMENASRLGISWAQFRKSGYRVIPVTISPRGK